MKQTYDIDGTLFALLNGSTALKDEISGGVYAGQRPLNSSLEDIVVNTIAMTQEHYPQLGTSNVNIHVCDKTVSIAGVQQKVEDRARLKAISNIVLGVIRSASYPEIKMVVEAQTTIPDQSIEQHYVNIRVTYTIHN